MVGELIVGEFKKVIAEMWRHREGNEDGKREVLEGDQDS